MATKVREIQIVPYKGTLTRRKIAAAIRKAMAEQAAKNKEIATAKRRERRAGAARK